MAGFRTIFCIGGLGGFLGADGINPIILQIWQGDADRMWFEPHYFVPNLKPIGDIKAMVPCFPEMEHSLIDACIAFYPEHFSQCRSLQKVEHELRGKTHLDFHLDGPPAHWEALRAEAARYFKRLYIFEAQLKRLQ